MGGIKHCSAPYPNYSLTLELFHRQNKVDIKKYTWTIFFPKISSEVHFLVVLVKFSVFLKRVIIILSIILRMIVGFVICVFSGKNGGKNNIVIYGDLITIY